jgi:23S rRNA pseudouridine2605 synthase
MIKKRPAPVKKNPNPISRGVSRTKKPALGEAKSFVGETSNESESEIVTEMEREAQLPPEKIRLNVYLQKRGLGSRRKCDELIEVGRVNVDGKKVTVLGTMISPDAQVKVDNQWVQEPIRACYYLLNKPVRTLTSRADAQGRPTIFDLPSVKNLPTNIQSVGRLDFNSEGLILLTNDGEMAYTLTHPKFSVEKSYAVLTNDLITPSDLEKLRSGVILDDGFAKPIRVKLGAKQVLGVSKGHWVEVVVTEGRNRLIRRIFEAVGLKVLRLVRTAIGKSFLADKHKPGDVLPLSKEELSYFEKLKTQMLLEEGKIAPISVAPKKLKKSTELKPSSKEVKIRKLKRTQSLNDEAYAQEVQRRSLALAEKSKERRAPSRAIKPRVVAQEDTSQESPQSMAPESGGIKQRPKSTSRTIRKETKQGKKR